MVEPAEFGPFRFDMTPGTLSRHGMPVRLQPQPARVLALLVSRAGEVVSREELRQQIWADGTYVDFERGLNFAVAHIRAALGDSAEAPRYIETVPKRGYRFVAPVRRPPNGRDAVAAAAIQETSATVPEPRNEPRLSRTLVVSATLAMVASATVLIVLWPRAESRLLRVAVVPFDNETGRDAFDQVAVAIADQTVARLATPERLMQLNVIGNAAVLRKPRAFRDIQDIGREVAADYVVLAQMNVGASGMRLIAHLIRTSDDAHVWANIYDSDSFTLKVQAEVAEAIAAAVTTRLGTS
jgi:DNA-binding winged helix-turn-helix (wHTH) protein/TolB-like protein